MPIARSPHSFVVELGKFYQVLNALYRGRHKCVCRSVLDCEAPVFKRRTNINLNIIWLAHL